MNLKRRLTGHNRERSKRPQVVRTALILAALGFLVYLAFIGQAIFSELN
jgi:hypothetical protein